MDYGAYKHSNDSRENYFLHPDDAAIPPVVRTAKPPSGFSPLTAPPKSPSLNNRVRPASLGSGSKGSRESDEVVSIGNLSIEPGVAPTRSSASINSTGSGGRKIGRSYKGLLHMASMERLREKGQEKEPKRAHVGAGEKIQGLGINGMEGEKIDSLAPTSEHPFADAIREGLATADAPLADTSKLPAGTSPALHGSSPPLDTRNGSPGGIGSGRFIPARDSSLRQRQKENLSHRKRRSHRTSDEIPRGGQGLEVEHEEPEKVSEITEEDDVERRIRELKAQKKQRDFQPTTDSTYKEGGPVTLPNTYVPQLPTASLQNSSTLAVTQKSRTANTPDGHLSITKDNVPSPAPALTNRDDSLLTTPLNSTSTSKPSLSARTSSDVQTSPRTSIQRSNSRFKRFSRPASPEAPEKHKRTFSNPLAAQGRASHVVEERPSSADSIDNAVDEYLSSPRLSQKIRHPHTGRVISFSEVGDPTGFAVFCCVGMGLTRYITAFYDELALTLKLRLITPDRPGVGDSEPCANDTGSPLGWPGKMICLWW